MAEFRTVLFEQMRKTVGETAGNHFNDSVRFHRGMRRDFGNRQVGYGNFSVSVVRINCHDFSPNRETRYTPTGRTSH